MRKICGSLKTRATSSLILCADSMSRPIGFSSTTRDRSSTRPAAARLTQIGAKRSGAVDRKKMRTSAGDAFRTSPSAR